VPYDINDREVRDALTRLQRKVTDLSSTMRDMA
jgi:hypothetical protein